jgi:hypothetical protein
MPPSAAEGEDHLDERVVRADPVFGLECRKLLGDVGRSPVHEEHEYAAARGNSLLKPIEAYFVIAPHAIPPFLLASASSSLAMRSALA